MRCPPIVATFLTAEVATVRKSDADLEAQVIAELGAQVLGESDAQ